jgi:hypothetical protein
MKERATLACIPDEAAASGFNPAIRLQLKTRQMEGSSYCEWILSLGDGDAEPLGAQRSPQPTQVDGATEAQPREPATVEQVSVLNEDFEKYVPNFKELRALYFLDYVDFIEAYRKDPRGKPMEIARQVRYASAYRQGARLAEQVQDRTLEQFIELYWHRFPCTETLELTSAYAVVRTHCDPFYEAFQQLGVSKARIRGFSDLFCVVEEGATKGFNSRIEFTRRKHLMMGDAYSEWEFKIL